MKILVAGLVAGVASIRRYLAPFQATPNTSDSPMKPVRAKLFYSTCKDLLIRRSWVRNPPGSFCRTTTYSAEPYYQRAPLAGEVAGLCAVSRIYDAPLGQIPDALRVWKWAA
jgi:hypothetical protein